MHFCINTAENSGKPFFSLLLSPQPQFDIFVRSFKSNASGTCPRSAVSAQTKACRRKPCNQGSPNVALLLFSVPLFFSFFEERVGGNFLSFGWGRANACLTLQLSSRLVSGHTTATTHATVAVAVCFHSRTVDSSSDSLRGARTLLTHVTGFQNTSQSSSDHGHISRAVSLFLLGGETEGAS